MMPLFENAAIPQPPPMVDVFEQQFWPNYPRQTGKARAKIALASALTKTTIEKILATLEWKKRTSQWRKVNAEGVHEFVPHPATFLNRGDYDDPMPRGMAPKPKPAAVDPGARARILELRAALDHQNHIEAMEEITSGRIYQRFPNMKPGVMKVRPCECWKCRSARGEL